MSTLGGEKKDNKKKKGTKKTKAKKGSVVTMESENPLHSGINAVPVLPNTRQVSESVQQGPEEEFLQLEIASEKGKAKLCELLPKAADDDINKLLKLLEANDVKLFEELVVANPIFLNQGDASMGTLTRFSILQNRLQQSLQPKTARISDVSGATTPAPTKPAAEIVEEVTTYIKSRFQGRKLEDVKLEEFEFPEALAQLRTDLPIYVRPDSRSKYPCLLLSGLPDQGEAYDELEGEIVTSISKHNADLFGVSGIGKTRRLYQMLCKQYGFLFLCGFADIEKTSPNAGARDFAKCVSDIKIFVETLNHDVKYVPGFIKSSIAARMLIFCVAKEQWPEMTPKQWLLIQLFPEHFVGNDIFLVAYSKIYNLSTATLEQVVKITSIATDRLRGTLEGMKRTDNGSGMLCFVDEAQKLHGVLDGRFKSEQRESAKNTRQQIIQRTYGEQTQKRDLLSCVAKTFNAVQQSTVMCSALLTGTGFRMQQNADAIDSAAGKRDSNILQTQFASMFPLTIEQVQDYIGRYIAIDKVEEFVLTHVAKWLTGRPRWTASFVEDWLMKRKACFELGTSVPGNETLRQGFFSNEKWNELVQNKVESAWLYYYVDDYVTMLTKRQVDDKVEARKSGYIEVPASLIQKFCVHADINENPTLEAVFKTGVFEYAFRGRKIPLPLKASDSDAAPTMFFVEVGVCCVSHRKYVKTALEVAELCEPLIVEAALNYFGIAQICINVFNDTMSSKSKSAGGEVFEHTCLPILNGLFNNVPIQDHPILKGVAISEQFTGSWRLPCSSYGVLIHVPDQDDEYSIVDYAEELCTHVVFEGQVTPLITTDNLFGGDLFGHVCCVDLDGITWCFMNSQFKFRDNNKKKVVFPVPKMVPGDSIDASTVHAVHLTVIPELIWHQSRTKENPTLAQTRATHYTELIQLLRSRKGIFRVILMYPANLPEIHNVQNGGVVYPRDSYTYDREDTARTNQGNNHDFLLVVHGGNIKQVLSTCYTAEEVKTYLDCLKAYKAALNL